MAEQLPERVSIFVDVQNIYYTTRQAYRAHFDYNAFWAMATAGRQPVYACAYAIAPQDERQRQFQNILRGIGFDVRLKPYIQRSDGSRKGDWDVGITIDMLDWAAASDTMVLASGDGDFDLLVQQLIGRHQVKVDVYGVPALSAGSLIDSASCFVPVEQNLLLRPNS